MRGRLRLIGLWYLLGGLLLLAVAIASLIPIKDVGVGDKTAHLMTYALLSGWFSLLAANRRRLGLGALGLMAYGVLIEALQGLTGYRHAEWADLLANAVGIGIGMLVFPTAAWRVLALIDARLAQLFQR